MTPPFQLSSNTLSSQPNHANDLWKGLKGIHRPILQGLNDRFILRTFHSLHYIIFRYLWPNYLYNRLCLYQDSQPTVFP
jgi:hypothetical protein